MFRIDARGFGRVVLVTVAASFAPLIATAQPAVTQPTLEDRLAWIESEFAAALEGAHAPGAALAIIKDGQVVYIHGFGVADLETGREVTPDTRFAVGSTTKAFTATLIGMLADEGVMSFDDPVRTHLPMFHLSDPTADEQVTVRDLLCHRTGFAVMNALWYGVPNVTRDEVLETLCRAELLYPFRERWNYSNESFLAAGVAAGNATGSDWDSLIRTRIFEPLGMDASNTTYAAAQADPEMAAGYIWDKDKGALEAQPMRILDAIAPAGSINSSVRDMSRWVIFQLGRGEIDGRRLISEKTHAETWTKQSDMSDEIGYGLGWMLRDWNGKRVIEHAGGIDGFTAEVAMLPDEGIGMVMLTNQFASPLQEQSRSIVFQGMAGDIASDDVAAFAEDFSPFLGSYTANFGPFKNAELKVLVSNGRLAVDVPGQMVYELDPPADDGRRSFVITDSVAVRFNKDDAGEVYSMSLFQGGGTFECIREGFEAPVEIDIGEAGDFLGVYRLEKTGEDIPVLIQNNRLAIDVPGQMVFELYPPDAEGWMPFRVTDTIKVRFDRDAEGRVVSMTQMQDGVETVLARTSGPEEAALLPDVDELLAAASEAGVIAPPGAVRTLEAEGVTRAVNMGLEGAARLILDMEGRAYVSSDLGGGRLTQTWIGPHGGLVRSFAQGEVEMTARMLAAAHAQNPLAWATDWRSSFDRVAMTGKRRFEGRDVYAIAAYMDDQSSTMLLDAETHVPLAIETSTETMSGLLPYTIRLADWRDVGGFKLPFRQQIDFPMVGSMVTEYDSIKLNVPVTDEMFTPPSAEE